MISHALHLSIFEQPAPIDFFNTLTGGILQAPSPQPSPTRGEGALFFSPPLMDLGYPAIPAPSTVAAVLKRNGYISEQQSQQHTAWKRFVAQAPNDLWQMDFKGHFAAQDRRCYPLTVLDDHSRYSLCIAACTNERRQTVQEQLTKVFRTYGLPWRMLMDNGPPWGNESNGAYPYTKFTVWLIKLGVRVSHSRPCHPQTMGKDERFHRTLKAEAIAQCRDKSICTLTRAFFVNTVAHTKNHVFENENPLSVRHTQPVEAVEGLRAVHGSTGSPRTDFALPGYYGYKIKKNARLQKRMDTFFFLPSYEGMKGRVPAAAII